VSYAAIKKIEDGIETRVTKRPAAETAVYLCMRAEHSKGSLTEKDLEEVTAADFARFAVGVTHVDFGGRAKPGDGIGNLPAAYAHDIMKVLHAPGQIGRISVRALLDEFPVTEGLALAATEHDVEHALEKVSGEVVADLIGYFRHQATVEQQQGRTHGVKEQNLGELQVICDALEKVLAKKIAEEITKGEYKDAYKRVAGVTAKMLRKPLHHVAADPKAVKIHLKSVHPPKPEHKDDEHGHGATQTVGLWLALKEVLDIAVSVARAMGWVVPKKGGGDAGGGGGAHGPKAGH
jgi:hypothetical protein